MTIACTDTIDCRNKIAEQLAARGIKALPNATFDKARLQIFVGEGPARQVLFDMPTQEFVSRVLKREIDSTKEDLSSRVAQIINQMSAIDDRFPDRILSVLPNVSFDAEAENLLENARAARDVEKSNFASVIMNQASEALKNKSVNEVATFMVGSTVAGRNAPALQPDPKPAAQASPMSADGQPGGAKLEERWRCRPWL